MSLRAQRSNLLLSGIKIPAQFMEALRADTRNERSRVRFSELS